MYKDNPLQKLRAQVADAAEQLFTGYEPRRYRDGKVLRDVVWGMFDVFPHELALIDSPLFQRLRGVFQTSLALLTYPCSVHSRFEHSLGALAVADRIMRALRRRVDIDEKDYYEIRVTALLHDWTHGPLSHTSEAFYGSNPIFKKIKEQHPLLFENANASEILTYCLLTSKPFTHLWGRIVEQYGDHRICGRFLKDCRPARMATMIVGADINTEYPPDSPGPQRRFLRQLINGPVDVDKLDYIVRDGYFTGLSLALDVERLLWVLDTVKVDDGDGKECTALCVTAAGANVLEQVLFAKMQLFSSVYHHHKVRVAHQAALRLMQSLLEAECRPAGRSLNEPATFICIDDYDLLSACGSGKVRRSAALDLAMSLTKAIRSRNLPMRSLVLTHPAWGEDVSKATAAESCHSNWVDLMKNRDQPDELIKEIAKAAKVRPEDVWIDIPNPVSLNSTGMQGLVKFDEKTFLPVQKMFPISGWLSAYQAYRSISYIFATRDREKVGRAAQRVLKEVYDIEVNDLAVKMARY